MEYLLLLLAIVLGYIAIKSIYNNNKISEPIKTDKPLKPKRNNYDELRNEYIKIHRSSNRDAVDKIDKHISFLKVSYPGRSLDWYVNRSIQDLKNNMF
jgi:hypothetical protein